MNLLNNLWRFIQQYRVTVIFSIVICGLFFSIGAVPEKLYFNQEAIANGEFWRLFTAHLVHSDLQHLIWNLCALLILSLLIEQNNRLLLIVSLFVGITAIDYFLWFNTIGIINYAGFSGVLNTLLVIALLQQRQKKSEQLFFRLLPIIIYIVSLLKIVVEIFSQYAIFSSISWQAVPQVHLIGFIAGTILAALIMASERINYNKPVVKFNRSSPLHNNG